MFGIGANELILILLFGFLIFGPDKLPAIAKTVGQAINKFKSAQDEMNKVIKTEVYDPEAEDPFKNPLDALSKLEDSAKKEDKQESFSERKARYDRQRAAKKAADTNDAAAPVAAAATAAAVSAAKPDADKGAADAKPEAEKTPAKPAISADDLYGTKPVAKKKAKPADSAKKPVTAKPAAKKPAAEPVEKKPVEAADAKPAAKKTTTAKKTTATKSTAVKKAPAKTTKPAASEEKGE